MRTGARPRGLRSVPGPHAASAGGSVNVIALAFLVLHTVTWSKLVPKVFYPRSHGHPLPEMTTALPSYILWAVATIVVAAFILGA